MLRAVPWAASALWVAAVVAAAINWSADVQPFSPPHLPGEVAEARAPASDAAPTLADFIAQQIAAPAPEQP